MSVVTKGDIGTTFALHAAPVFGLHLPRHYTLAMRILQGVLQEVRKRNGHRAIKLDWDSPFHLLVLTSTGNAYISFFCSGYEEYVDVQILSLAGRVDGRFREVRFPNYKEAVDFADRRFGISN